MSFRGMSLGEPGSPSSGSDAVGGSGTLASSMAALEAKQGALNAARLQSKLRDAQASAREAQVRENH